MKLFNKHMNKAFMIGLGFLIPFSVHAADIKTPKIGIVNFKTCVENSKIGKQEQNTFESLKKQIESILEEREKELNSIANKLEDPDYLDSLSPEAETDLKRRFRTLSQELGQQQNQFYQTLSQANVKIVQKLSEAVNQASSLVAKDTNLDLILNEEVTFYHNPALDISDKVIRILDQNFEQDQKETPRTK